MGRRTVYTSAGVALLASALVAPFTFSLTLSGGILLAFSSFVVGAALTIYGLTRHGGRRRYRGRRAGRRERKKNGAGVSHVPAPQTTRGMSV